MAAVQRGLGRGLDALLQGIDADDDSPGEKGIVRIPIGDIRPNAQQPRRDFVDESLRELADSIRSSGVLQPILVRPIDDDAHRFELVAGERRWRASQMADLSEIPAMVRELDDEESLAIALIENLQREDLNPIEEALGLKRLQEDFGLRQEDLAAKVGKSRPAIANTMRLLQLPEAIQTDIRNGQLSAGHGRSMLAVTDDQSQSMLHARCMELGLSVREAEAQASYWKKTGALPGDETKPRQKAGKTAGPREIPSEIMDLQERLADALGVAVAVKGDLSKGRLVLSYASAQELESLLERLGSTTVSDDAMVSAQADVVDIGDEPPEISDFPVSDLHESLMDESAGDEDVDETAESEADAEPDAQPTESEDQFPEIDQEALGADEDSEAPDLETVLEDESDSNKEEDENVDPVEAMLAGDEPMNLADMLGDDEDEEGAGASSGDDDELDDFDDDELAELDKALDEILDETKNA